ncbi:IPT/TIG domain-containing protein [Streptacidiphilus sp. N1-3]|uniref:IPT/TIG domain-containing protein n=1 Tax=Streptacidiphilus alkalitolerans TaxID=3342712 RepID=A0ABV6X024_9ACTN
MSNRPSALSVQALCLAVLLVLFALPSQALGAAHGHGAAAPSKPVHTKSAPSRAQTSRHPNPARRHVVLSPAALADRAQEQRAARPVKAASSPTRVTVHPAVRRAGSAPTGQAARTAAQAAFSPPFTQCPAVGYDTSCGILVNVTSSRAEILADPAQQPYDGSDDTLIGVVNSTDRPIGSLSLSSSQDIFGFDGDGICSGFSPGPVGCPFGPTGYEGPGTSFSGINADATGGTVTFTGGLAPGASAYFSLEEALDPTTTFDAGPTAAEQGGPANPSEHLTTCYSALPVNCATGAFEHTFTDFSVPGPGLPLTLARSYDSTRASVDGMFGHGWSDGYGMSLAVDPASGVVTVTQENGSQVAFTPQNGTLIAPPRILAALTQNPDGGYTLLRKADRQQFTFTADGTLVSQSDRDGDTTRLQYAGGELAQVTDPSGRSLTFAWSAGHVSSVTDPLGRVFGYHYDAAGDLVQATDPAGHSWTFGYDGSHLLLTMTDPRGGTVANVYDASGRVVSQTDPAGLKTSWSFTGDATSPAGGSTSMVDPHGSRTVYTYADLELLSVTHAAGTADAATTSYTYDPATLGQATVTDPLGQVTTSTYDQDGNLTSRTAPLGDTSSYTYDPLGDLTSATSPLGETTGYGYDAVGNRTSVSDPDGGSTTYTYGGQAGEVTGVTDPDGRTESLVYDSDGDVVATTLSPTAGRTDTARAVYDADGEKVCAASPVATAAGTACPAAGAARVSGTATTQYNADGTVHQSTDADGRTTSFGYDAAGNRTSVTDASGHLTQTQYDADDRPAKVVTGADGTAPSTTSTSYDLPPGTAPCGTAVPASYCTASTDADGAVTVDYYGARDELLAQTRPGGRTTGYGYDLDGRTTTGTDPDGRTTTQAYDQDGRLGSRGFSDNTTPGATYTYDPDGRRTAMTDGTGTTTYAYDNAGRLLTRTDGAGATVGYAYDGAGNISGITYPGGRQVIRTTDGADRLSSVTDWLGHTSTFGYDADGNPTTTAYADGDTATSTFTATDLLSGTRLANGTNTDLASISYQHNADNLLTAETDSGALTAGASYAYDADNRLTGDGSTSYGYDPAGNPTTLAGSAQTFNAADQLLTSTTGAATTGYGYNAEGERTSSTPADAAATGYSYDQAGDLLGVTRSQTAPTLGAVTPHSGPAAGGTTITLTGTGFTGATAVHIGTATAGFTVVSDTTLSAVTPAGSGTQPVTVTTPGGTTAPSAAAQFTYIAAPTVTALSPAAGPTGGGTAVTITGTGFTGTTAVHFGAAAAHLTAVTSTKITATAPPGAGTVDVTVTTPGGTSARTTADHYTYSAAPTVTRVSPNAGPTGGGTTVTVTGTNLTVRPISIHFGSRTATLLKATATALTVRTPTGSGTVDVTVTTSKGTSAKNSADHYTYRPRPRVTHLAPASGTTRGGTTVTITGTGFTGTTAVHFGSKKAAVTAVTSTRLKVRSPAGTRTVDVTVTTAGGTSAKATADHYTYRATAAHAVPAALRAPLAATTGTAVAQYAYDGDGLRTTATAPASTPFTWDSSGSQPLLIDDGTSSYVYGPGGLPLEQISDSTAAVAYFVHDSLGSTRLLLDAGGSIVAAFSFGAYGRTASSSGTVTTPLLFAAGYHDAQTGLYYLVHRYYDPATGQFLTLDPALALTGAPYGYAGGDPTDQVDPTGLSINLNPFSWTAEDWGTAAGVVAIVAGGVALCAATACIGDIAVLAGATTLEATLGVAETTSEIAAAVGTGAEWVGNTATAVNIAQSCYGALTSAECGNAVFAGALGRYTGSAFKSLGEALGIPESSLAKLSLDELEHLTDFALDQWGPEPFGEGEGGESLAC